MKEASRVFLQGMFNHFAKEAGIDAELNDWRYFEDNGFYVSTPLSAEDAYAILTKIINFLPKETHSILGMTPSPTHKGKYRICFLNTDKIYDYALNKSTEFLNRHYPPLFQENSERHSWIREKDELYFYNYNDFCTHQFMTSEDASRAGRFFTGTETEDDRAIAASKHQAYEQNVNTSELYLEHLTTELPHLSMESRHGKRAAIEVITGGIVFDTFYALVQKDRISLSVRPLRELVMNFFKHNASLFTPDNIHSLPEELVEEMRMRPSS